jgi:hypothetical protein
MKLINNILTFLILHCFLQLLFFTIPLTSFAQTQEITNLKSLTIELLPEFDSSGVLVIYEGTLASNTSLPATVSLHLPSKIKINAVAFRNKTTNNLILGEYVTEEKEDKILLTYTARTDNFWIEFYTPGDYIAREGDRRDFEFSWDERFSVDQLVWHIQKPNNATDFKVTPANGEMILGNYGIPTYKLALDNHTAMQVSNINVSYVKSDDTLTSSVIDTGGQSVDKLQERSNSQTSSSAKRNNLSVILFVIIIVVIVIGFIVLWPKKEKES